MSLQANGEATPIVTARAMRRLVGAAGPRLETPAGARGWSDQAALIDRYNGVLEKIEKETATSSADVLVTVQDREASLVQSRMAELAKAGQALPAGGLEAMFGEGAGGGDIWGWFKSLFNRVDKSDRHPIVRPPNDAPGSIADVGRVALISDWGTDLYGAPVSARSILASGGYEMVLHLGDIYYSGTKAETKKRFIDVWPIAAGKISRALNGNHEMYSGGFAYFDDILPAFGQASSYFALQNGHWLLVGLDTACTDQQLDDEQVRWLLRTVQQAGNRKLILFSHHQAFSRLDKVGPALQTALAGLFARQAVTAWYWGHEHACVLYDRDPVSGMVGRCVGNGGIPAPRKSIVRQSPIAQPLGGVTWRRLEATAQSPGCLYLDGPNPFITGEEEKFGPHGYVTLKFDGPALTERIHLADGTMIFEHPVA